MSIRHPIIPQKNGHKSEVETGLNLRELTGRRRSGESLESEAKRNERAKRESAIVAKKAVSLSLIDGDPPPRKSRW